MENNNINIGIENHFKTYQVFINAAFIVFAALTVVFWILVYCDRVNNNLLNNGIEVKAERVDVIRIDDNSDNGYTSYHYECVYEYVSPQGVSYSGRCGPSGAEEYLRSLIGTKVSIVIDPDSTYSETGTLADLARYKDNIYTDFPLACVFSGMFCISAYLFFYRVIYRNRSDKKIFERAKNGRFVNNYICEGEVIKVLGWIVCYVKVRYRDDSGYAKEKWARSWFTHREAKFLQEKKKINIVPYKKTYGILEEMPAKKKQKSS